MSAAFSLSEFTQLVSAALEIDANLDSKLVYSPAVSSYPNAIAKPNHASLPPTPRFSAASPRVLRKIKSLLAHRNQPPPPPPPSPPYLRLPLLPRDPLVTSRKPIPTVSLLDQEPNAAHFVPYLPLADRHERTGDVSIFSRRGSYCGSSIVPPTDETDSVTGSPLPTPPQSPTSRIRKRASSVSSLSSHRDLSISTKTKHSSLSSFTTSSYPSSQDSSQISSSSLSSHSSEYDPDTPVSDPFAKGQVQVLVARPTSLSNHHAHNSQQSTLPVEELLTASVPSSPLLHPRRQRSVAAGRPKRKPPPTYPLPLPPKRKEPAIPLPLPPRQKPPTGPLPPVPGADGGLPSPPMTPPDDSSIRDWTLELPYTSDEDVRRSIRGSQMVSRRRYRSSKIEPFPVHVLPYSDSATQLLQRRKDLKPMGHKRKGSPFPLTLAPLPSPPSSSSSTTLIPSSDSDCASAPPTTPTFRYLHLSLQSSSSSSSTTTTCSSDCSLYPMSSILKRREMLAKEPARMVLGEKGLPVPGAGIDIAGSRLRQAPPEVMVTASTPTEAESGQTLHASASVDGLSPLDGKDKDEETPVQSPTTPTAGRFAIAQSRASVNHGSTNSSQSVGSRLTGNNMLLAPGTDVYPAHRRSRPRQRVPESVVLSPSPSLPGSNALGVESTTSDAESTLSGEETAYWSARSSLGSFNESRERWE